MMLRRIVVPLLVLAAAVLGSVALVMTAPSVENVAPEETLRSVRVMEGHPQTVQLWVRSQGTVAPRTESELIPEVSGPVVWVSPALVSGGFFEAGAPLLRIDTRDYEAAVARARAAVARAEGDAEHASAELRRLQGLSQREVASESQLSQARRASRVGQASLDEARVALDQAERDLARTQLDAPFAGRVRVERVDVGQFVSRGQSVATLYATDFAEIRLPIADGQLAYLELPSWRGGDMPTDGPAVRLHARFAGTEHEWRGRVVRTEGEIDPRSRMVQVVARVEDPYGMSRPEGEPERAPLAVGLFVRAEIAGPVAEGVIVVPRSALRDDERILIVDKEDRLQILPVEVLRIDGDDVLLRAELAPGERICVSPLQVFVEGMRVRPVLVEAGNATQLGART